MLKKAFEEQQKSQIFFLKNDFLDVMVVDVMENERQNILSDRRLELRNHSIYKCIRSIHVKDSIAGWKNQCKPYIIMNNV